MIFCDILVMNWNGNGNGQGRRDNAIQTMKQKNGGV